MKPLPFNNSPFCFFAGNGTIFNSERCDLKSTIFISNKPKIQNHFLQDVSEMIAYHRSEIYPNLNGFAGYDTLDYHNTFIQHKP